MDPDRWVGICQDGMTDRLLFDMKIMEHRGVLPFCTSSTYCLATYFVRVVVFFRFGFDSPNRWIGWLAGWLRAEGFTVFDSRAFRLMLIRSSCAWVYCRLRQVIFDMRIDSTSQYPVSWL